MADKVQINPVITAETRETLRRACQERGLAQGDIVELALVAFFRPTGHEEPLQRLADQQVQLLEMVQDVQEMFLQFLAALGTVPTPEATPAPKDPVPIATYEQMYGPIAEAPTMAEPAAPAPQIARSSLLRRWFVREEPA